MENNENENEILQNLKFRIVEVSSEEEGYPVTELLNHTPFSRGWQSSRFCDYPQEIILEFPSLVRIKQMQFLSHQYKITSKIEIFIQIKGSNNKYKKIGYLSLDSNERSNFQARELKTVYINYECTGMKILLNRCFSNIHNIFSQVGLIAINILGFYDTKAGDHNMLNENKFADKLEDQMIYDPLTLKRLKTLYKAKEKAIELEDFDEAKKIKDAIGRLKSVSQQLLKLEERKAIAIKNEDYDSAKMLKYEVERLRNAVAGIDINNLQPENIPPSYNKEVNKEFPKNQNPNINYANDFDNSNSGIREIPVGNKNYKLMGNMDQRKPQEMPLTSDLVMDDDDNMNKVRNVNPNQGYKLMNNKERNIINVDEMQIKGNNKDFNELVMEKLEKEGGGKGKKGASLEEEDDDIPAAEFKKAEPLIPILTHDIIKLLFSKYWRNKEEGINKLIDEVKNYPHSDILGQQSVDNVLNAVVGACANVLGCNVSQPLMASMDLLKILFNKFRGSNMSGYLRTEFNHYVDTSLILMIEKVGDANLKLKERAENTILEMANNSLVGHKIVFEQLISGQVKKTLVNSAKHLSGRLNLISRMIDNFGLNSGDVDMNSLMNYAINGFKNPNKEVRDAAFNLIMNSYKFIGDSIRSYFKDLRPNQINILEDGFEALDGLNNYGGSKIQEGGYNNNNYDDHDYDNNNNNDEFVNDSQIIYGKKSNTGGTQNKKQKNNKMSSNVTSGKNMTQVDAGTDEDNFDTNNNFNNNIPHSESATTCQFCGIFDPNFDEDAMLMHCYSECVMLNKCYRCDSTIEISHLNFHYLKECEYKNDFKECNRCKEPVEKQEYDQHVAEKLCIPAKNVNVANRCPLCHSDITPAGKVGWEVHLLQNGCPNNPRAMN